MHACTHHESCVEEALTRADRICHEKGLRFTQLRREILEMIWGSHTPAKAYDLLDKLKENNVAAKPPTVYRTLDFLLEHGLIHKLSRLNAYVGCSHPLTHNECYFLMCRKCGDITECCNDVIAKAIMGTVRKSDFNPWHITLEIEGECHECAERK